MLENEGEQELETNSDDNSESSSETPSGAGSNEEGAKAASLEQSDTTNLPFHEHPRFKELVEQKNQALAQSKALEERYSKMEAQLQDLRQPTAPKTRSEVDEVIEHLKTIDPRFAAVIEKMAGALPQVETLQKQLQDYQQKQVREQAVSQVNALHESNKVAPELRDLINAQLDSMAISGQIKNLQDIPNAYKSIHEGYSKFIEGIKRSERESYVSAKKADAVTPTSQPKGKPVSHAPKQQAFSKDPEVARQQVVSRYLKQANANKDI